MNKIILYTTHCPKCTILEKKLNNAGLSFEICSDIEKMKTMGMLQAPMLEVDGNLLDFSKAITWLKEADSDFVCTTCGL